MRKNGQYTLAEIVDLFLTELGIDKKKYFSQYLVIAGLVWQDIFRNTLWVSKSVWLPVKAGEPYDYIEIPCDSQRIFAVTDVDHCGNLQPLYYNPQLNVIPKPKTSNCGCGVCDCGGMCEEVGGLTLTTKLAFTINGIDYYEKEWMKYCPNGDIMRYREVPTKKFNDRIGDGGDFNDDQNDDYLIGNGALANFTIVTQTFQDIVCQLKVRICGCPEPIQENRDLLIQHCGCHFPIFGKHHKKCCREFQQNVNNNHFGEAKIDECGTRILVRHLRKKTNYLQLIYQSNGRDIDQETQVPDYALDCMQSGIDHRRKRFKTGTFSKSERDDAKYMYIDEQNKLIGYLNPLDWGQVEQAQDTKILW